MIYLQLFLEFFKIGLFTFGGGYAMIPIIKETVVDRWLSESEFYDFIGICESTPGPIAVNMATYVGSSQAGFLGSIFATIGVILPSFIIILLIATLLKHFIKNKFFQAFLSGIKPIIIALIISTGFILLLKSIGYTNIHSFRINYKSIIIFSLISILYLIFKFACKKKLNTIFLILFSAVLGIIIYSIP